MELTVQQPMNYLKALTSQIIEDRKTKKFVFNLRLFLKILKISII